MRIFEFNEDTFAESFKKIRRSRGMSRQELAHHLNCCHTTIVNYESRLSVPPLDKLILFAKTFDIDEIRIEIPKDEDKI